MKSKAAKSISQLDAMRESEWLSTSDLLAIGKESAPMKISAMEIHEGAEMGQGKKVDGGSISFDGVTRKLFLNSTNRKTIRRLFGDKADDIIGQTVVVYVDHKVRSFGGEYVDGLRLKGVNE